MDYRDLPLGIDIYNSRNSPSVMDGGYHGICDAIYNSRNSSLATDKLITHMVNKSTIVEIHPRPWTAGAVM